MLRVTSVQSIPIRNMVEHSYLDAVPRQLPDLVGARNCE